VKIRTPFTNMREKEVRFWELLGPNPRIFKTTSRTFQPANHWYRNRLSTLNTSRNLAAELLNRNQHVSKYTLKLPHLKMEVNKVRSTVIFGICKTQFYCWSIIKEKRIQVKECHFSVSYRKHPNLHSLKFNIV
jgi:hypothetical protein